jgi:hypothetical protein
MKVKLSFTFLDELNQFENEYNDYRSKVNFDNNYRNMLSGGTDRDRMYNRTNISNALGNNRNVATNRTTHNALPSSYHNSRF